MHFAGPSLVAVATGIVGSAWTSGAIVSFSVAAAPAAKAVHQTTAQVWSELYARGANLMPKVATVVALSYAYAAYDVRERGGPWLGFVAAAASVLTIVPFTLTVMKTTNAALESAPADRARVSGLIDTWAGLNPMRGLFPLVGTILGIKAFYDNAL